MIDLLEDTQLQAIEALKEELAATRAAYEALENVFYQASKKRRRCTSRIFVENNLIYWR